MDAQSLISEILAFRDERDWAQFHTPKNLAAALAIEASELQELMLWKEQAEVAELVASKTGHGKLSDEIADVLIYALLFCDAVGIDPGAAIRVKLKKNAEKYSVAKARGSSTKYSEIRLSETDSEYLLAIPSSQRDRAKGIEGRRWDPGRTVWVYPRTKRAYDALLAEFGDDPSFTKITQPSPERPEVASPEDENRHLRAQVEHLQKTLAALTSHQQTNDQDKWRDLVAERDAEIERLRSARHATEASAAEAKREIDRLQAALRSAEKKRVPEHKSLGELAKAAAIAATDDDEGFVRAVERLPLTSMFAVEVAKKMEVALRLRLGVGMADMSLFDLISEARASGLLPDEAIDLAHTIRRQRNFIAHYEIDPVTNPARILLVLFAASVLWPYLTQWKE